MGWGEMGMGMGWDGVAGCSLGEHGMATGMAWLQAWHGMEWHGSDAC